MHHDKCYDAAVDAKICFDVAWEYIDGYKWMCSNGTAVCAGQASMVPEKQTACKTALCACDAAVVQCWSRYPKPEKKLKCNHIRKLPLPYGFQH
ncbi:hypothetical protein ANCCEY_08776 [Ancylostoma ceylanicum]|uniref:Phospholipase A2-like central domain-containing protein n=1 Tax=Ancylostoma ceylanicum TaxID=53326 RepID=A0A0D6LQ33_9BILA|nr:hypothetical protein ANCCEY_08776 [Ancylostoma ceylanicum]